MADRRLLAIMFSDVVGYSSSMAASERAAMDILEKNRRLVRDLVSAYGGAFRKEIGDGTLSSFPSAIDAVACAIEIQSAMAARSDFRIRIGIHVGDVIEEGGDVFGDGVNIASRLEPQAPEGGICVSAQVAELVRNKPFISLSPLGERELKGVGAPMPLFSVSADPSTPDFGQLRGELRARHAAARKTRGPSRRFLVISAAAAALLAATALTLGIVRPFGSPKNEGPLAIAVLPFDNFNHDESKEYIVDGMTEELTKDLAQVESLRVISRTSVMSYKGKPKVLTQIAKELGVDLVIEGSVLAANDRLKVTAQLIRMDPERHVAARSWEEPAADILSLQAKVSSAIVEMLKVSLSKDLKAKLATPRAIDPAAYDLYLKAWAFENSQGGLQRALDLMREAVAIDPSFADAWASIASLLNLLQGYGMSSADTEKEARASVAKVLELDPDNLTAHSSRAFIAWFYDFDFPEAEKDFLAAVKDGNPNTMMLLSMLLTTMGKLDESVAMIEEARRRAPNDPMMTINVASRLNHAGRPAEAVVEARKAEAMAPENWFGALIEALALAGTGDYAASAEKFRSIREIAGGVAGEPHAYLVWLLEKTGAHAEALRLYGEMKAGTKDTYVSPFLFAIAETGLGRYDDAMESLRRSVNERDPNFAYEIRDRALAPLHGREDWKALMEKVGLSP